MRRRPASVSRSDPSGSRYVVGARPGGQRGFRVHARRAGGRGAGRRRQPAEDTQQLLQSFSRSNPDLRAAGNSRPQTIGGRQGITTPLSNVSNVTGEREYITLSTTQLRDGSLLYIIGVAPQSDAKTYESAFRRVRQSLQIAD
jgi:hypothetical protein